MQNLSKLLQPLIENDLRVSTSKDFVFKKIDKGSQSTIYSASQTDSSTIETISKQFIVKKFLPDSPSTEFAREREYEGLQTLANSVNGSRVNGWTVITPIPLGFCRYPPAIIMSEVAGQNIDALLRSKLLSDSSMLRSISTVAVHVLQRFWECSQDIYGDVNLNNILCNIKSRTISFLDPGAPTADFYCDDVSKLWYPCSRDIAYLLFGIASTNVKKAFTNPDAVRMRTSFGTLMLSETIRSRVPRREEESFIKEVEACANYHIERCTTFGFPKRVWLNLVRMTTRLQVSRWLSVYYRSS